MALDLPTGPALPFRPQAAAPAPKTAQREEERSVRGPDLTLEQYATFRAQLAIEGENNPEVWANFGVASQDAKEALQARFAEQFRRDPGAQCRVIELVSAMVQERRFQR